MTHKIKKIRSNCFSSGPLRQESSSVIQFTVFILFIAALASCKNNSPATAGQQLPPAGDSQVVINDSVQSQYNAARMQLDAVTTKNFLLDSLIREKDAAIARLKWEVIHLKKSNRSLLAEIKKDKKKISEFENELNDKVRSFAERIGLLQSDRDNLARERDGLKQKYKSLKDLASVLHASNIRLTALHLKHNGKEKKTARARKADVLRISFDIDENRIAEDGTKYLYLSIKDPEGHLLTGTSGPGVTNSSSGTSLNYTLLKEIPLKEDEPVKDVTVDWKQDGDYEKGVYSIAIYNGGYKIGGGDVTLN